MPGVEKISAWTWFQGKYGTGESDFFARFAVDPDVIFDIRQDIQADPEQVKAFYRSRPDLLQGLRAMVLEEQVVDSLVGGVTPVAKSMALDELLNPPQPAQA